MSSYYRLLGVSRNADLDEIRHAYWSLSRRVRRAHGHGRAESSRLTEIRRAYETLSDLSRRRAYDARQSAAEGLGGCRSRYPADLTPDRDVACDFPSMSKMAQIVPRMCDAFFGVSAQALRAPQVARIELTPQEARQGACIPFELAYRPDCPICGGRGESWSDPCGICAGAGSGELSHRVQLTVPAGVRHNARLRYSVVPPFAPEAEIELQVVIQ